MYSAFSTAETNSFVHLPVAGGLIMSDYRIAILPGDGTGREVALEAENSRYNQSKYQYWV